MELNLRPTAFRGDPDLDQLHSFFQSDRQFTRDTLWTFGTSVKSAYVNSFEFMNHAPVVQLWRDDADEVQVVSRLSLGTAEWFHQAAPAYRGDDVAAAIVEQADAAFALLTDHGEWATVRYESRVDEIGLLERAGYERADVAEVYMTRPLDDPIDDVPCPAGIEIELLDTDDPELVHERALAQVDAFTDIEPTELEVAWVTRSVPHLLSYGRPDRLPNVVATDSAGAVLAFADAFFDRTNRIGEFEPVGTRKIGRRRGLAKAVMVRGLREMRDADMTQAVVRTGFDNHAAIAAYESVGFEVTDRLVRFRQQRSDTPQG